MSANILFSSVEYDRFDVDVTLPAKFARLIDKMGLADVVKDKLTAIKMHLGGGLGYSTVHPLFIKILIDKLKEYGAKVYITDQNADTRLSGAKSRGYTEDYLGVPLVPVCGITDKYYYEKRVHFNNFHHVDIGGSIYDADVMIDLSHVKGHGACGYGGACKNIAMGCVTDRTRRELHGLEGGLAWDDDLCIHCGQCLKSCNHGANAFNDKDQYEINFHHCTYCQHCVKVCPTKAIKMDANRYEDFQMGMAICTEEVLKAFEPGHVFYINFLTNITAICDCWGLTTPSLVPDIGIMASQDIVAIERACLDAIKVENLLQAGVPKGHLMRDEGHLFERLHGKNPYIQVHELEKRGLGTQQYDITEIE